MKVKFVGNPLDHGDNKGFIELAGVRFDLNVPVELPEGKAFAKIPGNSHFEVVDGDDDQAAAQKALLIEKAERLDIKIDKRWNAEKIQATILEHTDNGQF